jgi:hypothetical protein
VGVSLLPREGGFKPWWTSLRVVVHGWSAASGTARLNGRKLAPTLDAEAATLSVDIPDAPKAELVFSVP